MALSPDPFYRDRKQFLHFPEATRDQTPGSRRLAEIFS